MAAANSLSKEPGTTVRVIPAVVGRALHLPDGGEETDEQTAKLAQLAMDTIPVVVQGMLESLPIELLGQILAAYKDENGVKCFYPLISAVSAVS